MRRLLFVDFLRGISIICVIFFHAMAFNIFGGTQQALEAASPIVTAIAFPIGIIGSWGAIFVYLSGISNSVAIYNQLKKGKKPGKVLLGAILPNLAVFIINYVFLLLFSHHRVIGDKEYYSIINGALETLTFQEFDPRILIFNSSLIMIGIGTIISNIFLILFRKSLFNKKSNRIYWILVIVGLIIIGVTPVLDNIFQIHSFPPADFAEHTTVLDTMWENERYGISFLISIFIGPRHSVFPFVACGLFGAIFGIMILRKEGKHKLMKYGFIFGAILAIIGFLLWIPLGVPSLNEPKYSPNLYVLDIGLIACVLTLFIIGFEYRDLTKRQKIARKTVFVRRYNMISMTIFVFESPFSTGIAQLFNLIFSPIIPGGIVKVKLFGFLVYLPFVFFLWYLTLRGWEKVNFKGSIEWISNEIVGKLRKRKSDKLNVNKILYNPELEEEERDF